MGLALCRGGSAARANQCVQEALSLLKVKEGLNHVQHLITLSTLAEIQRRLNQPAAARATSERILDSCRAIGAPMQEIATLQNLAVSCIEMDDWEAVVDYSRAAIALCDSFLGGEDALQAISLENLGLALIHQDEAEEALRCMQRALQINIACFGERSAVVAHTHTNLGLVYEALDRKEEAEATYRAACNLVENLSDFGGARFPACSTTWRTSGPSGQAGTGPKLPREGVAD